MLQPGYSTHILISDSPQNNNKTSDFIRDVSDDNKDISLYFNAVLLNILLMDYMLIAMTGYHLYAILYLIRIHILGQLIQTIILKHGDMILWGLFVDVVGTYCLDKFLLHLDDVRT